MKLHVTQPKQNEDIYLLEILADNNQPANAQNPINRQEFLTVDFPDVNGELLIISGMPMSAVAMIAIHYKNLFSAIAVVNAREKVAEVIHSMHPDYKVSSIIPMD